MNEFRLFPQSASSISGDVDRAYFFLIAVATFFTGLIFVLIVYFALRYSRKRNPNPEHVHTSYTLEIVWTIIPLIIVIVIFSWGAKIYVHALTVPDGAMEIHVLAKQWMWKTQHPTGQREINELHIPVGRPVRLMMASQDVIHSFYVPAFRIKRDVDPGRFNQMWFEVTAAGEYHLFCAEYCGSGHSSMIGRIVAMDPGAYQQWLAGTPAQEPPVRSGEKLFVQFACNTCHGQRAPTLAGLYGRRVQLADGSTLIADDNYIRESILSPNAKFVAGYPPLMPTYQSLMSEEQLIDLVAYIKSLKNAAGDTGILPVPPK